MSKISKISLSIALIWGGVSSLQAQECIDGLSGSNLCNQVNQYAFVPSTSLDLAFVIMNDNWGWVSPTTGKEYALQGGSNGTYFFDVTVPNAPVFLGKLPTHDSEILWRDIKVYQNYAFIVAESSAHGMQVFDLTQLESLDNVPVVFEETTHYPGFGNAHNIAINEETGFAYAVGSNTFSGGLHFVNIQDPLNPLAAGGFEQDGYTHDVQVVSYIGPDQTYAGREIAFASNENSVTIVDVSVKNDPQLVAREEYPGSAYAHQGWLTEDHRYFLMNDELDESTFGHNTRTYVWDVQDLDNPVLLGFHESAIPSIDHNLYVRGNYCYQANYTGGLRVLQINDAASVDLEEVAYYDIIPDNDNIQFTGSWNIYPYFPSGTMILSNMYQGMHILQPDFEVVTNAIDESKEVSINVYPNPASEVVRIKGTGIRNQQLLVHDITGKLVHRSRQITGDEDVLELNTASWPAGIYLLRTGSATERLIVR